MIGAAFGVYLYLSHWHNRIIGLFTTILTPLLWLLQLLNWLADKVVARIQRSRMFPHSAISAPRALSRTSGMRLSPWLDIAAVSIPLGQAIGRIANYVNQELYGAPTNSALGHSDPARRARRAPYESLIDYPSIRSSIPIWAYEAIWSLIAFYVLWRIYHQYRDRLVERRHSAALHRAVFIRALPAGVPARRDRGHWRFRHQQLTGDHIHVGFVISVVRLIASPSIGRCFCAAKAAETGRQRGRAASCYA